MTFLQSNLKINVCRRFRIAYATYLQNSKPIAIIDIEYSLCLIKKLVSKAPSETVKGNFKNDINASPLKRNRHNVYKIVGSP
jgi:hypothetical protein